MDFGLDRYVDAQSGVIERAMEELRRGDKQTHWMWFVFPQLAGLGRSPMAQRFAISSIAEARAYLRHPVLGPRLIEAVNSAMSLERTPQAALGAIDALKLRSSLTLFEAADLGGPFAAALDRLFAGSRDERTLELLAAQEA
jgi:uncharacterized protein (DUF1810 family)